jgi:hypothetical protein
MSHSMWVWRASVRSSAANRVTVPRRVQLRVIVRGALGDDLDLQPLETQQHDPCSESDRDAHWSEKRL